MNILLEFNKFNILGPHMKPYFFIILFSFCIVDVFAQEIDARCNALEGCGLTQNTIWSNFINQAGLVKKIF
ncbi:MAG: hypothetical protein CBC83_01275 [Flavobacteriales bacterium TMED123]|nr:MAG: hypothetical protein CBC83_01275 [Flavobacteriales bacterium TMED123]|tara:strand:- start:3211 stop:3423 length:213 start_codon:yes stop_codon:yes gene_type:complete